jgi:hypothetical protein
MKETQGTYVVTAVYVTQRTIKAKSQDHALQLAEVSLIDAGATSKDLSNWHAHRVNVGE